MADKHGSTLDRKEAAHGSLSKGAPGAETPLLPGDDRAVWFLGAGLLVGMLLTGLLLWLVIRATTTYTALGAPGL